MKSIKLVCNTPSAALSVFALHLLCMPAAAQTNSNAIGAGQASVPQRVIQAVDSARVVPLAGTVHQLARPEFDQGAVAPDFPMRMLLLLQRSPEQQTALDHLMFDQYNRASANFHAWLAPEEFGQRFGPADADIQAVTTWIQSQGLQVAKISKGKIAIELSGTAASVGKAFHMSIHQYVVNGERHWANATEAQIPAALVPVVRKVLVNNFGRPKPMLRLAGAYTKSRETGTIEAIAPQLTTSTGCGTNKAQPCFAIGPADFATIYNVSALYSATPAVDGTGQSIAVIGTSNINLQDVANFRSLFGLSTTGAAVPQVIIDGGDPGIVNDKGQETEALADVEWAGAVAKGAQIHLVISADTDSSVGLILAAFNVVDNNSDPVMNVSFGLCEPNAVNPPLDNSDLSFLWEQAAAQGITVTVAAGDNGSAGCEDPAKPAPNPATTGLQVNGLASTPFNVAVGGTDFNDAGTQSTFFSATNDPITQGSAKGYIPESTWNDSCTNAAFGANAEANCNSAANAAALVTVGGSGGASTFSAKPDFQAFTVGTPATSITPADGKRDLPDVSLFAGDGFPNAPVGKASDSFYVICQADNPSISNPSASCQGTMFQFIGVGGTSVSSSAFAGLMALVNQLHGRQGNANFVLYKLAQLQIAAGTACASVASPLPAGACVFNDVQVGTNAQPCAKGTPDCTTAVATDANGVLSGFPAGAGYDLATGLGSVNAANLVIGWAVGQAAFIPTTTALQLNGSSSTLTGITVGNAVNVAVTITATSGSKAPSGDVGLVSNATTGEGVDGPFTLVPPASGTVTTLSTQTSQLRGNSGVPYQVTAHYTGDGTFAPSDSNPVTVTGVTKANSTVTLVAAMLPIGNSFLGGPAPATLFLRAVVNATSIVTATGTVDFSDTVNGTTTTVASGVRIDQSGEALTVPGVTFTAPGTHSISAHYSGDPSFNPSDSTTPFTFPLSGTGTGGSFAISASPVSVMAGSSGTSTVTVTPSAASTGSLTVAVTCPAANLPPGVTCSPNPLNINVVNPTPATGQLTVAVAGPSSTLTALAAPLTQSVPNRTRKMDWMIASAGTGFAAALLLILPGRKRLLAALGLGLVCWFSSMVGCTSSSTSTNGGTGGGPVATTTKLSVVSTKVPSNSPTGFQFTVAVTSGNSTPTGQVQLVDQTTNTTAPPATLSNGTASINLALSVGTHAVMAKYLGDSKHTASQSGALNCTTTGTAQMTISSMPAASNGNQTFTLTVN